MLALTAIVRALVYDFFLVPNLKAAKKDLGRTIMWALFVYSNAAHKGMTAAV
jgi:hypothetical protein